MNKFRLVIRALTVVVSSLAFASIAQAAIPRTYVSINGIDTNPCNRIQPCRNIQRGIEAVLPGGEVVVLDTGNYRPFTVDRSVLVRAADGASPGITITSGNLVTAVTIAAGASDTVTIRGLTLNGLTKTQGSFGIFGGPNAVMAALHVEDCTILNFGLGMFAAGGPIYVKNTVFSGNLTHGLVVGIAKVLIENCRFENNTVGLLVTNGASVTMRDSAAFGNSFVGFQASSFAGSPSDVNIENCVAANNFMGIRASLPTTVIKVANSTITNNTFGLDANGGAQILSRRIATNTVEGNGSGEIFTGTFAAK